MDDSQGSDIFSRSVDMFCDSPTNMDQDTYESFIANTKSTLSMKCEIQKSSYSYFASLLNGCYISISKSLDLIIKLFSEHEIHLNKLIEYINNISKILNMLSDYINCLIESKTFTCENFKMFPGTTGRILLTVFTHCKDSESIYGRHLGTVEKQLKELFCMCHELQLTYLLILEKHFLFDLIVKEDCDILVEALELNLKIGEIVHKLDAKTMAEQWKAFTAICEKYSSHLNSKDVVYNCIKILCEIIEDNITNAEEIQQEEKVLLRSCKITSFIIKILIKVYNIFKHDAANMYDNILKLLILTFLYSEPYMELSERSSHFISLMNTNITVPMECLLKELLSDEKFVNCITTYDIKDNMNKDNILGFILVIGATIKILVQLNNVERKRSSMKIELIQSVYRILPCCHNWFYTDLKFKVEPLSIQNITIGLNEYLLVNTTSLVATMTRDEYNVVEECMMNALLSTDSISAMFSANLWTLLSRYAPKELTLSQVETLCKIYIKLENNVLFENSPQKVHLICTIVKLFECLNYEQKSQMYKRLPFCDNVNVWSMVKIKYLPEEIQKDIEIVVFEELKLKLANLTGSIANFSYKDIKYITHLINLASTLSINYNLLVSDVVCIWLKLCPENNFIVVHHLKNGTLWCVKFMEALTTLTCSMADILCSKQEDLAKMFHVISKLVQIDCIEIKLLLIELLCTFCIKCVCGGSDIVERFLVQSFRGIIQSDETVISNKLALMLQENVDHVELNRIITKAIKDQEQFKETLLKLKEYGHLKTHSVKTLCISSYEFVHKCIKEVNELEQLNNDLEISQSGNNFDLIDIDALFNNENDTEPQCKKVKLSPNEVDEVLARLEADVSTLHKIKENITSEHKLKIKEIYENLQNIAD